MGALPLILMFIFFALGVPVAIALISAVLPYFMFVNQTMPVDLILQRLIGSVQNSSLWAIPYFIMAGTILNYSGVTSRLMNLAEALCGHLPGALAQVNVLLSAFMGGISGSSSSDAASDCKILVPEMVKRGYGKPFSAAVTAASSIITPIIPPGIGLILFAYIANVSVGKMFMAGYIPGIIITIGMMILVHFICKKKGYVPTRKKMASLSELWKITKDSVFALMLPLIIIMAIRLGIVTPTECGALCVFYALFVGIFIHKELKLEHIWPILKESFTGTAVILMVLCSANAFGWYLSYERLPIKITEWLLTLDFTPLGFLMMVNILFLVLGLFMEGSASIVILVPLLIEVAKNLGIDMVHLGLLIVFNAQIGAITPPFGPILFLISPLLDIDLKDLSKACLPFVALLVGCLLLFTFFPALVTFLPSLVFD